MERHRQTLKEVLDALSSLESSWRDSFAEKTITLLGSIPTGRSLAASDLQAILDQSNTKEEFEIRVTAFRLFLDLSQDEFEMELVELLGNGGIGINRYKKDSQRYIAALSNLGLIETMMETVSRQVTWADLLEERLKSGRGSAIKGQRRGRLLEDFVEERIKKIFDKYDVRCRFQGASGESTETSDFAIPSKKDPRILVEAKAYGATGSKQSDTIGTMERIIAQKRHDTTLLLVTDGLTWLSRKSDLEKIVKMQNQGRIARIYTTSMSDFLLSDLEDLKKNHKI